LDSGAQFSDGGRRLPQGETGMTEEFIIGINIAGKRRTVMVAAEDALIAALKVKHQRPEAVINYVRRRNKRGDLRHPHESLVVDTK
jgi:hypothetical protein